MAKEIKKDIKADNRPRLNFAFGRKNYLILGGGLLLMIIGYVLLSGGGSKDPNVFSTELFSTQRMVVAPIILLLGFLTVAFAIMYHPKEEGNQ